MKGFLLHLIYRLLYRPFAETEYEATVEYLKDLLRGEE